MIYIIFSVFIIIILFICARYWYLWRKISVQKNEWVAQTKESDTILRSMNVCFILINSDLVVIRTNYYDDLTSFFNENDINTFLSVN